MRADRKLSSSIWDEATQSVKTITRPAAPVVNCDSWDEVSPETIWVATFAGLDPPLPLPPESFMNYWRGVYSPNDVAEALRITAGRISTISHEDKSTGAAMYASGCLKRLRPGQSTTKTKTRTVTKIVYVEKPLPEATFEPPATGRKFR